MKRNRTTLVANDSSVGVRVHVEDLHPNSRLRKTIEHDRLEEVECGFSLPVLLSLLATYRHNRLIVKPGVNRLEVMAEMKRDCVNIRCSSMHPLEELTQRMCDELAAAISEWPLLWNSLENFFRGGRSDWNCSGTHCYIEFPRKPRIDWNRHSKTREIFSQHVAAFLFDRLDWKNDNVSDFAENFPNAIGHLQKVSPFWWLKFDNGTRCVDNATKNFISFVFCQDKDDDTWCLRMRSKIRTLYESIPDVSQMLHDNTRALDICIESLAAQNITLKACATRRGTNNPIVFTTMWYDFKGGDCPRFMLEIDST